MPMAFTHVRKVRRYGSRVLIVPTNKEREYETRNIIRGMEELHEGDVLHVDEAKMATICAGLLTATLLLNSATKIDIKIATGGLVVASVFWLAFVYGSREKTKTAAPTDTTNGDKVDIRSPGDREEIQHDVVGRRQATESPWNNGKVGPVDDLW